eukprot:10963575-Alexandrium_andersonii.AAC.1
MLELLWQRPTQGEHQRFQPIVGTLEYAHVECHVSPVAPSARLRGPQRLPWHKEALSEWAWNGFVLGVPDTAVWTSICGVACGLLGEVWRESAPGQT